jgi:hypothetical protein
LNEKKSKFVSKSCGRTCIMVRQGPNDGSFHTLDSYDLPVGGLPVDQILTEPWTLLSNDCIALN